jgi:acetyl esterase/lipase
MHGWLGHTQVILLGDSAGGALCFALSLRLAAAAADASREQLQVAGLVAICPWVTHEFETPSMREMHGQDYLHAGVIRNASRMYVGSGTHHMHPEVSVSTHPSVHLLPPCLMLYGDREMFASSIVSFAQTLKDKACQVELVVGKDMPHVYPSLWPRFQPESTRALERIADFCAERVCVESA